MLVKICMTNLGRSALIDRRLPAKRVEGETGTVEDILRVAYLHRLEAALHR